MKIVLLTLATLACLALATGTAIVGLGLYNVSAHAGHFPGVGWLLHTTYRRSVKLRAPPPSDVPDLEDPDLIALGVGHFATACAPCHSGPSDNRMATIREMLPVPPPIREAVADWQPNHLHWIIEKGVKMSGMPGWPARDRPDEVWSVVAYLAAIKRDATTNLPAQVAHDPKRPAGASYCETCHTRIKRFVPRLDILDAEYISESLEDYRDGTRQSGIMKQAASLIAPRDIPDLAAYFAERGEQRETLGTAMVAGEELARKGTRDVPSCTACHGPERQADAISAPALAGQDRDYLERQLTLWRDEVRTGSNKMTAAARALTDEQIALLADWYAALAPD